MYCLAIQNTYKIPSRQPRRFFPPAYMTTRTINSQYTVLYKEITTISKVYHNFTIPHTHKTYTERLAITSLVYAPLTSDNSIEEGIEETHLEDINFRPFGMHEIFSGASKMYPPRKTHKLPTLENLNIHKLPNTTPSMSSLPITTHPEASQHYPHPKYT
jgi:hypothetical protein